jgi:hypothetical protein
MLFRLSCSEDRQGQLHNLYIALIVHQDKSAPTSGLVNDLAVMEMRELSQHVFALFKRDYIDVKKNFFSEVADAPVELFFGSILSENGQQGSRSDQPREVAEQLAQRISAMRSLVKSFVIYQLSNSLPPTGSGVGCGYYDEQGTGDGHAIAKRMNEYVFNVCFNPDIHQDNVFHFIDYCLSNLTNSFFSGRDEEGYFVSKAELPGGLDPREMGLYWRQYGELVRQRVAPAQGRRVVTPNYIAFYREDLAGVFSVLDELANDATTEKPKLPG